LAGIFATRKHQIRTASVILGAVAIVFVIIPRVFHSLRTVSTDDAYANSYVTFDPIHANSQISVAVTSMLTLIAYRFAVDSQLPRLPYMTRLDAFILTSTLLVFFSLIEVLVTTILDNNQQTERAKKIDRYCRAIFPVIFVVASIAIFVKPRD
jgi:cadmium resistance protein CadD (predicted permease)